MEPTVEKKKNQKRATYYGLKSMTVKEWLDKLGVQYVADSAYLENEVLVPIASGKSLSALDASIQGLGDTGTFWEVTLRRKMRMETVTTTVRKAVK